MSVRLKPLTQQTIVITGATSGIGLTTARMAAKAGARVMAVSRDEQALQSLQDELTAAGGLAAYAVADVSDEAALNGVVEQTVARFGRIDTWVNNAAVAIYGRVDEVTTDDARRLFDVNFWGQVYGARAAVRHFRSRGDDNGGYGFALVNVGSVVSERVMPLQGYYGASKHAVRGFTDALRMELEEAGVPVSVTLIKPASIDTPFVQHAKNYMDREPNYPPPVYTPDVVARAILHAAVHPTREMYAGGGGPMISLLATLAPRLVDRWMERSLFQQQQQDAPSHQGDALREPGRHGMEERGNYPGHVMRSSLYTQASMHPVLVGLAVGAVGIVAAGALSRRALPTRRQTTWAGRAARALTRS
jgi:NAD(P)-dependent dehydrogenase (short-subunit alcohol dehydrogenase family)